jgi:predicted amidophosphoribosyltransferase
MSRLSMRGPCDCPECQADRVIADRMCDTCGEPAFGISGGRRACLRCWFAVNPVTDATMAMFQADHAELAETQLTVSEIERRRIYE